MYWNYYNLLEQDFINTLRYVALDYDNFDCFSNEYIKLLELICSEVENILKCLCGKKNQNIKDYREKIIKIYPKIVSEQVYIVEIKKYKCIPFKEFKNKNAPDWWKNYNSVKHNRLVNYKNATQKNVLDSLAALFLLEQILSSKIKSKNCIILNSNFFYIERKNNIFDSEVYMSTCTDEELERAIEESN